MAKITTLENGLTLIVDEMPNVESAAYELLIPGGITCDSPDRIGASMMLAELMSRGAGTYSSREFSDAFEEFGIAHSESAGSDRFGFRGALLGENMDRALELLSLMIQEPTLAEEEVQDIRQIFLQDLSALSDNPSRWATSELSRRYFPDPHGRPSVGTAEGFNNTTIDELREEWRAKIRPGGAVLSLAGSITMDRAKEMVASYFGKWKGTTVGLPKMKALPSHQSFHIERRSAQLQITAAFPSAPFGDEHFYAAKVASVILSGGMFGRLFIEVREKRGLCYSVYARHSASKDYGVVFAYAGTTPERAHETFDVMMEQLRTLKGTVTQEELERARANVKSSLILGEESSGARASSNGGDWWLGGRVRTTEEILAGVNGVTTEILDAYLERFAPSSCMTLTLGDRMLPGATVTSPLILAKV